jgi:hypothetical protein
MGTVAAAPVAPGQERTGELPERVQEALGELAGAAKEGLLAFSVGVGLGCWSSGWSQKSTRSSGRRAATIATASGCGTATTAAR